jgi:chaperonin GroEL
VALIRAREVLRGAKLSDGRSAGVRLLLRACEEPLRQISSNAGQEGSVVLDKVMAGKGAFGFNAATETYEDLEAAGVIDPTKVVRTALENASSVSGLLLTTEALIAERPKKEEPAAGGHGHSHGGGMDF